MKKIKVEQDAQLRASFSSSSGAQVGYNDVKAQFLSCSWMHYSQQLMKKLSVTECLLFTFNYWCYQMAFLIS